MLVRHEASTGGGMGSDLVKVLPAGRGNRGSYAELICVRLGGDPDNGQPGALHCMPCIPNKVSNTTTSSSTSHLCTHSVVSERVQLLQFLVVRLLQCKLYMKLCTAAVDAVSKAIWLLQPNTCPDLALRIQ